MPSTSTATSHPSQVGLRGPIEDQVGRWMEGMKDSVSVSARIVISEWVNGVNGEQDRTMNGQEGCASQEQKTMKGFRANDDQHQACSPEF